MSALPEVSQSTFPTTVLASDKPVLVDFWAPWCGPCKMLAPVVEKVAGTMSDRVSFVKLNTDEAPSLAGEYQVSGIPCLILFKAERLSIASSVSSTNRRSRRCSISTWLPPNRLRSLGKKRTALTRPAFFVSTGSAGKIALHKLSLTSMRHSCLRTASFIPNANKPRRNVTCSHVFCAPLSHAPL